MNTPADLAIRFARPDDVPTILTFIRELGEYEKLSHEVIAEESTLRATLFGVKPAAEVLIAELGGTNASGFDRDETPTPVGFALFFQSYSTFLAKPGLYLEDLFVRPAARGKGIGAALMSALARIAVQRNYGRFEWSVLDWNARAISFYERMGATVMPEWRICRVTGEALARFGASCDPADKIDAG